MSTPIQINNHRDTQFNSWFLHSGEDFDVVLSSRVGINRNLKDTVFPLAPSYKEDPQLMRELMDFLCSESTEDTVFQASPFADMAASDRKLLSERRLISSRSSRERSGALICDVRENLSLSIFHQDHLRFAGIAGGNELQRLYHKVIEWCNRVEKNYPYAQDESLGYLTARVEDCGLGLRLSSMLHLIMTQEMEELDRYFFQLMKKGYTVRGFTDNKEEDSQSSLGGFYQIYAPADQDMSAEQLLEEMEEDLAPLFEKERNLRQDLKSGRFPWVEDKINRSFGILKYCKLISADEAQKRLSYIRLGITLGWVDGLSLDEVSAMLILIQDGHISTLLDQQKDRGPFLRDERRARFIREVFESGLPYRR